MTACIVGWSHLPFGKTEDDVEDMNTSIEEALEALEFEHSKAIENLRASHTSALSEAAVLQAESTSTAERNLADAVSAALEQERSVAEKQREKAAAEAAANLVKVKIIDAF